MIHIQFICNAFVTKIITKKYAIPCSRFYSTTATQIGFYLFCEIAVVRLFSRYALFHSTPRE